MHLEKLKILTSRHNKCRLRLLWVEFCFRVKEVKGGMVVFSPLRIFTLLICGPSQFSQN